MTPEAMAALHAACFTSAPRPWHAREFEALKDDPRADVLTAPGALAVIRTLGSEAELLTLATDPAHRRKGAARGLLTQALAMAEARGAEEMFLEVAADNSVARALYAQLGFGQVGLRRGYYAGTDALTLRKPF